MRHDEPAIAPPGAVSLPFDAEALARRRAAMRLVLALSSVLLVVKGVAAYVTGSSALLSDALESVVNVVTGAFGLFSVWLAGQPPDTSHPYGHGRVEFFAAGLEGAMILLAAFGILREAVPRLFDPRPIEALGLGLGLAAAAGALNGVAGALLVRQGRRVDSPTLVGEGRHLLADTVTTAGVVLGLLLVRATGWLVLDPVAACIVALLVAASGLGLMRESAVKLMDRSESGLLEEIARGLGELRRPEWIEVHLLRAWRSGSFVHIDFHMTFPRWWPLERVHASQHLLLEQLIRRVNRPGEVMVHPDPCRPALCASCAVAPCLDRGAPFLRTAPWTVPLLVAGPEGLPQDDCVEVQAAASREITAGRKA